MLPWLWLLWIPFLILLTIYCRLEKQASFKPATALKVVLSAYVAVVAVVAAVQMQLWVGWLIAAGLLCAVPADYFLQYIRADLKKYKHGILCFGAMHICLIIAFFSHWGVGWLEFVIWAVLLLILAFFQTRQKWDLGEAKLPLSVYTALVTLMAAKAVTISFVSPSESTLALGLAGLCFFISDLFLGVWAYHNDSFGNLATNRIVYFCGQLLFAFHLLLAL